MVEIFKNERFGEVRVATINEKPYFMGSDVARALGYSNPQKAIIDHCKEDGITIREVIDSLGRKQDAKFISEGNMYRLIAKSTLPSAEKFESWVFDEIVPSIRKDGGYIVSAPEETTEQLITRALQVAQAALERSQRQLEAQAPKVLFADAVATSDRSVLVSELAKVLKQNGVEIGQNRLFSWLRQNGYLLSKGDYYNQPAQKYMEKGLFELKKTSISKPDGTVITTTTTKITGRGCIYFTNKFLSINEKLGRK